MRPIRNHQSVFGSKVTVKSRFGPANVGSLKTLVSMPALTSASVGVNESGPR